MFEEIIRIYKKFPKLYTNEEWIKKMYDAYIKFNPNDLIFINFFVPNTKDFEKKMQYMIEMFEKGKSSVDIYDIIENYTNDLWD